MKAEEYDVWDDFEFDCRALTGGHIVSDWGKKGAFRGTRNGQCLETRLQPRAGHAALLAS